MDLIILTSSFPLNPDDAEAAAGHFVADFAVEAASQGHQVRVLTQTREGLVQDPPSVEVVRYPWLGDKPLSTLSLRSPSDLLAMSTLLGSGSLALTRQIRRRRPDLVLAMWAVPSGLLARAGGALFGVPYRVWALGSDIWDYGRIPGVRRVVRQVLRGADVVFADGIRLAEDVSALGEIDCTFVPSCRQLPLGQPRPAELFADRKNFVFLGRFHPNKGPDLLVEAVGLLEPAVRARIHVFMFGGGPLDEALRTRVRALGLESTFSFLGYAPRERATAFLEHCDWLVIPSRIESIPVVFSDALQAKCPVLCTDVGDLGRIIAELNVGVATTACAEGLRAGLDAAVRSQRPPAIQTAAGDFSLGASVARTLSEPTVRTQGESAHRAPTTVRN